MCPRSVTHAAATAAAASGSKGALPIATSGTSHTPTGRPRSGVSSAPARLPADPLASALEQAVVEVHDEQDAVIAWEAGGAIIRWSPGATRVYGWTVEEALGAQPRELLGTREPAPDEDSSLAAPYWEAEVSRRRKDGSEVIVEAQAALRSVEGRPVVIEASWDITGRRNAVEALAEREQQLAAILAAARQAHDAIIVWDRRGGIRFWNRGATELYGWSAEEAMGRHTQDLFSTEGFPPDFEQRLAEGFWEGELIHRARTGERLVVESRHSVLREGGEELVFETTRDVTARKLAEDLRESFIAMLSHELRTPVTSIYAGGQLLLRESLTDDMRQELLSDVVAESERLAQMIENLLVLARVERGALEMDIEPVLVRELVPPILVAERRRSPTARIDSRLPRDVPLVAGDRAALSLVVRNLTANAVRYGPDPAHVLVSASGGGNGVELTVSDNGTGISPEQHERIFELFYRAPDSARRTAGSGVGLFVVRALVSAMGGTIRVESSSLGGASFVVTLPIYAGEPLAP